MQGHVEERKHRGVGWQWHLRSVLTAEKMTTLFNLYLLLLVSVFSHFYLIPMGNFIVTPLCLLSYSNNLDHVQCVINIGAPLKKLVLKEVMRMFNLRKLDALILNYVVYVKWLKTKIL